MEGLSCSRCRPHHFHLSTENREGCLPCFCMGVTQQCTSSSYYRDLVSLERWVSLLLRCPAVLAWQPHGLPLFPPQVTSPFLQGDLQGFALVNRQHSIRIQVGFTVEVSSEGPQLSYGLMSQLGQEPYSWQLPEAFLGDKVSPEPRPGWVTVREEPTCPGQRVPSALASEETCWPKSLTGVFALENVTGHVVGGRSE